VALFSIQEPLLRADQVAEYLGISVQTLSNWRLRDEGPVAHKVGGRSGPLRYQRVDVEKWLKANREVGSAAVVGCRRYCRYTPLGPPQPTRLRSQPNVSFPSLPSSLTITRSRLPAVTIQRLRSTWFVDQVEI